MNEEEKFDELLRSKLSEREFPFDGVSWDEAERLIIKQEKWGKISRISLIFFSGLAAGIAIMLLFMPNTPNVSPGIAVSKSTTNQSLTSPNSNPLPANQSQENTTKNSTNGEASSSHVKSAPVEKKNDTTLPTVSSVPSASPKVMKAHPTLLTKREGKKPQFHHPANEDVTIAAGEEHKVPGEKEPNPTKQSASVNPPPASDNNIAETNSADKTNNNTSPNATRKNTILPANSNSPDTISPGKNILANIPPPNTNTATYVKLKKDSNKAVVDSSLPMFPGTKPDSLTFKADGVSLLVGITNYTFGWKVNGQPEGWQFDAYFFDVNYVRNFSKNWEASIGIGFTHWGLLNETYTSSSVQYDFGQTASVTTVTPGGVYYMDFPLAVNYNVNHKWAVSGGLDFLWMLTDYSTITTYQQTLFGTTEESSSQQDGYTQGFNNYNFHLTGGFTYMLGKKTGLKLEGYWGINSVKNDAFPGPDHSEHWNGVRLFFVWNIFKKQS